jgi:predicted Holliday junction resolvase-like endonuclease
MLIKVTIISILFLGIILFFVIAKLHQKIKFLRYSLKISEEGYAVLREELNKARRERRAVEQFQQALDTTLKIVANKTTSQMGSTLLKPIKPKTMFDYLKEDTNIK